MGATLPIIIKIFTSKNENFTKSIYSLYFINTLGAAFGCFLTSYLFISFFGFQNSIFIGAIMDIMTGIWILIIFKDERTIVVKDKGAKIKFKIGVNHLFILVAGFIAIGYEIIFIRVISVLVKSSPYAYATTLFIYLLGIAFGSLLMHCLIRKIPCLLKLNTFLFLNYLIGISVLLTTTIYYQITLHSSFKIFTELSFSQDLHPNFHNVFTTLDILIWPIIFLAIPTLLMGAYFPLITTLVYKNQSKPAYSTGSIYFFSTLGNLIGGIFTGLIMLTFLGTERSIFIYGILGILFILFFKFKTKPFLRKMAFISIPIVLFAILFPVKGDLYKVIYPKEKNGQKRYIKEGFNGTTVAYYDERTGELKNYIDGLAHGGRPGTPFYWETVEGIKYAACLKDILVIGYGTGSTTENFQSLDSVNSIDIVEINRTLIRNLKKIEIFQELLSDKRINLIFDDGRRFLLSRNNQYDFIAMDPLRSTTIYSNNLYSKEFFELIKEHLKSNGVFLLWNDNLPIIANTLVKVFDNVRVYKLKYLGYFFIVSNEKLVENNIYSKQIVDNFRNIYGVTGNDTVQYIGNKNLIKREFGKMPINTDFYPRVEYFINKLSKKNNF